MSNIHGITKLDIWFNFFFVNITQVPSICSFEQTKNGAREEKINQPSKNMPEHSARNLTTFLCVRFCVYTLGSFSVCFAISGSYSLKRVRAPVDWKRKSECQSRSSKKKKKICGILMNNFERAVR